MRKTIGMLGTGLVTYMQNQQWRGAIKAASEHGARLVYYPTISLSSWPPFPPQPKVLFDLVGPACVDGLLVWYAGIAEGLGVEGGKAFLGRYASLPMVTVGGLLEGRPDLSVGNYRGARAAVEHLIREHGRRRIAVIRGPAGHPDADERYRAYVDALAARGLEKDERFEAEALFELQSAAKDAERIVKRWLIELRLDIDAIVCASDYIALPAIKAVEECGRGVPQDISVIGFDDVDDARASVPSLSTVRQPFFEMGYRAVEILVDMMEGAAPPMRSLVPAQLVLRESCGCLSRPESHLPGALPSGRDAREALEALSKELSLPSRSLRELLGAFMDCLASGDSGSGPSERFFLLLRRALVGAIRSDFDSASWLTALRTLKDLAEADSGSSSGDFGESLLNRARFLVSEMSQRSYINQRIKMDQQNENMRQISESLITSFGEPLLGETLVAQLPKLGFPSFYLSLYEDPEDPPAGARLVLAYSGGSRLDLPPAGIPFDPRLLLPREAGEPPDRLVAEPLYFRDEQLGILALEAGPVDGPIYENLRAQISSALQGSKLLGQVQLHATRLEMSVAERTSELTATVKRLQVEIDERGKAEKALSLSSFAMARVSDAVYWISPQAVIIDVNLAACEMLGRPREELLGSPLSAIDPEFAMQGWESGWRALKKGIHARHESIHLAKDGRRIPVEIVDNYIVFEDRELSCSIVRDISLRKEAEAAIRRMNEDLERRVAERTVQLEEANRELEAFAYSVSHDLRAPLRAINGFSRILVETFAEGLPEEARSYLDRISQNTLRMSQLISDLLAFSRVGRDEIRRSRVEVPALVREVIEELKASGEAGRTEFVADPSLPPCEADRALLKQVWTNLISNAVKYSAKRDAPRVEIGHGLKDGQPFYWVKDNGVGFDMRWADKLFGVFQRLHGPEDYEGTGIGLAIVKRIVKRHGGDAWAESKPDGGAVFSFRLGPGPL